MKYEYRCSKCNYVFTKELPMAEMEVPMNSSCPNCGETGNISRYHSGMPGFTDSVSLGRQKAPEEFRNFLSEVGKKNPGHNMPDR